MLEDVNLNMTPISVIRLRLAPKLYFLMYNLNLLKLYSCTVQEHFKFIVVVEYWQGVKHNWIRIVR